MKNEICETGSPRFERAARLLAPGNQATSASLPIKSSPGPLNPINDRLPLSHALRVRSAEYWLMLGGPDEALRELEVLPRSAWNHPAAVKVRVAALEVLDERTGAIVEEVPA